MPCPLSPVRPLRRSAALALATALLASACAVPAPPLRQATTASQHSVETLHAVPAAAAPPAAPAAPSLALMPAGPAPIQSDSDLVVPALGAPEAATRSPWQPPDVPRRAYPRNVERWRPLVRQIMAEEWQKGTLDGLAQRLDDDLVLAVMEQESRGFQKALSPVGAVGLMQVMPETFALMMAGDKRLVPAIDPDAFWDEGSNVRAGIRYLALAFQHQEANYYWSVASYNAGIAAVKRWRLAGLYAVPPIGGYTETAEYAQIVVRDYLAHRPGLEFHVPDPMPLEHVAGAMQLLRTFRPRG